jgi:hypothetical protein
MRRRHVALILCGASIILFLIALRPWLPFYADVDYSVLTVKVTFEGKPVNNTRVELYDQYIPTGGSPYPRTWGYTNSTGEVDFTMPYGNYTVKAYVSPVPVTDVSSWGKVKQKTVFLAESHQEVDFTFVFTDLEPSPPKPVTSYTVSYMTIIILCVASGLMIVVVTIFIRSRKKVESNFKL